MMPTTKFDKAEKAYIEAYGKKDFFSELEACIEFTGKTLDDLIAEEIRINGAYSPIILHIKCIQTTEPVEDDLTDIDNIYE